MASRVESVEIEDDGAVVVTGMQALHRGLRVLNVVADSPKSLRFTSLQNRTGLPKGTLHRILQALIEERYLDLDPSDQSYRLGLRPFQLAHRVWDQFDLRGAARPELMRLAGLSDEAARLAILDGDALLIIDQVDTQREVRISNGIGSRGAVHAMALGKAMAAYLNEAERARLLSQDRLSAETEVTVISQEEIHNQLNIIRARGYAVAVGEHNPDLSAVAAPILNHAAEPIGAIGIVAPSYRMDSEKLHGLGREVIEAARRISGRMGELFMSISPGDRPTGAVLAPWRVVFAGQDFLGEGPIWDAETSRLHWVDILAPALFEGDPNTGERRARPLDELVGVAIPREAGGLVCAMESGIKILEDGKPPRLLSEPEADLPENRFNDGKCDALGRLWIGSLAINTEPDKGALWRIDPDGSATRVESGFHVSNGIGWSPDNGTFYFADSGARCIFAYDFDLQAGTLSNKRVLVRFAEGEGTPDGLAVDQEGQIWVAMWDGWSICTVRPDGSIDRKIAIPVPRPTSCTFGGTDMSTLFVTTARIRLSAGQLADAPMSGSVLAIDTGVSGLPVHRFAG